MPTSHMDTVDQAHPVRRMCMLILAFSLGSGTLHAGAEIYVATVIDPSGQLRITTKHKHEIVPKKETQQVSFFNAQITPDGRAVGWLAMYTDCCASDPVALKLVVLVNGEQHIYTGTGLPISGWCFWAQGKQVAFKQQTERGGNGLHYELRDLETGAVADKYDPDVSPNITKPPRWVVVLDSTG